MEHVQKSVKELYELFEELEAYTEYKELLISTTSKIESQYVRRKITYREYNELMKKVLKERSKETIIEYYDSYMHQLIKKMQYHNANVFYYFYQEIPRIEIKKEEKAIKHELIKKPETKKYAQKPLPTAIKTPEAEITSAIEQVRVGMVEQLAKKEGILIKIKRFFSLFQLPEKRKKEKLILETKQLPAKTGTKPADIEKPISAGMKPRPIEAEAAIQGIKIPEPVALTPEQKIAAVPETAKSETKPPAEAQELIPEIKEYKKPEEIIITKRIEGTELGEKEASAITLGFAGITNLFRKWLNSFIRKKEEQETRGKPLRVPEIRRTLLDLVPSKEEFIAAEEQTRINPYLLSQEAKRIRAIIKKEEEIKIYRPSSLGALANLFTRKLSLYLLDKFPDFFRYLYNGLRSANIKMLSNTYLNITVLFTAVIFVISNVFFALFFVAKNFPLITALLFGIIASIAAAAAAFAAMYYYPFSLISARKRNIASNLPFAINHMSAVVGAGVPPASMFRLIAESKEYDEICIEIEKIVEFVEVFGYDLVTAIKSVSATTPNPALKEFFDGFTSTVETGGDLKQFLKQKADEALLEYTLEREKYLENISTYSDIYTGILIAAPLFFVVALALVSLLGGQIGGIDVSVLMLMGTYVIIPFINTLFIIFLQMTQPGL